MPAWLETSLSALLATAAPGVAGMEALGPHSPETMISLPAWHGYACIGIFVFAYIVVMTEEYHNLRKSKPVIMAAGAIWAIIALGATARGVPRSVIHDAVIHELTSYASMFLFLLVSMTYVNAMNDRNVFAALRSWIVRRRMTYRQLLWATGGFGFVLSAVVDNLISALLMGAVVMAIGRASPGFIGLACVNVVVAANSGGAFCPFGDITTLMVWQSGHLSFFEFFELFPASLATWLIPAAVLSLFAPTGTPEMDEGDEVATKRGARRICMLFALTIALAVCFEHFLGLPPFLGMMTGMSLLMIFTYYVGITSGGESDEEIDVYREVGRAEWDTLLFFFGVIFAIGGLAFLGYLEIASHALYGNLGPTASNVIVGVISAVIDNIPVMFAILSMEPDLSRNQWLLVTMTVGIGGSLLSIGSAAGVALMGISHGKYTFMSHLKWAPVILLGYAAGVLVHLALHGT